jgi:PAS domain S-box-containing protein
MTTVLIVDDKDENIYYLETLLTGYGFRVITARHGAEALMKARQTTPDIIISDLLMPVMDGYTLLRLWKADNKLKTIPFIVYTATYTEPDDERLALGMGADAFLLKTVEPDDFIARLWQVLAKTTTAKPYISQKAPSDEKEMLQGYSETLVRKLEAKTWQLEESNRALQADIDERNRIEESLRLLSSAVMQAKDSILITDAQLDLPGPKIIYVNPAFTTMTGYTEADVIGKTPRILQGPRTDKNVLRRLREALDKNQAFEDETIQYRKDGSEYVQEWQVVPLKNAAGKITHYLGIQRDTTERKLAEDDLRVKTAFLEAQVDSSLDGILVVDEQGNKLLQNQHMTEIWNIPPHMAADADDTKQLEYASKQTKNPAQFIARVDYINSHPDEVYRDEIHLANGMILDRYSSPVRDKMGKYYGRIWNFRDISEQRKLEEQLRQSQKMEAFGQLAGGVAHDFNNILAIIQLGIDMLKAEQNLSSEQLDFAEQIETSAKRAANLTRQLLLFSRKQAMQLCDLDLNDIVGNMTKMLGRTLGEHINITIHCSKEPVLIHADAGMIEQILLNLAVNARDALPKGGQIIIETSAVEFDEVMAKQTSQTQPGVFACLSVTDNGTGIPNEIQRRIFEPFFTTKDVGKGTGLGLATVFGIVQQHKGWITVNSEVGIGTTFHVYLPHLIGAQKKPVAKSQASIYGGNETILLVEDDDSLRDAVRITLTRLGYHVLAAATADEAFKVWHEHHDNIHLLLTDLQLPGGMNGKQLAEKFLKQNPKLKVIYSSGYPADIIEYNFPLKIGVNFLSKPFESDHLAQTVNLILRQ